MKGLLCYGLSIVGMVTVVLAVSKAWAMTVNYAVARLTLVNLLRSNPKGALQYCRSVPGTFFDSVAAAIVTASMAQTQDLKMIQSATYPSYDAGGMAVGTAWKMLLGKAKLGVGMAWGAVAAAVAAKVGVVPLVIFAIMTLLALGWLFWSKMESERIMVLARHEILPEVDRVFVEGRYA
ncbi:MAG: hypothetical protein IPI49_24585 [Myxococcales bacterium]|nr:hypothetical protein [Myxococcales bacterium]